MKTDGYRYHVGQIITVKGARGRLCRASSSFRECSRDLQRERAAPVYRESAGGGFISRDPSQLGIPKGLKHSRRQSMIGAQ